MSEMIKEYGRVILCALECGFVTGLIGFLFVKITQFMLYYAERMMGRYNAAFYIRIWKNNIGSNDVLFYRICHTFVLFGGLA